MSIVIGILIGAIAGVVLGLLPAFNIGFALLFSLTIPDPYFATGLIIGIDSTSSVMKHLSILTPNLAEDSIKDLAKLSTDKVNLCWTSIFSGTFGRFIGTGIGIGILLVLGGNALKFGDAGKAVGFVLGLYVWGNLIFQSKNRVLAVVCLVSTCLLAVLTTKLPINQPMFVLASCLFSSSLLEEARTKSAKVRLTPKNFHNGVNLLDGFTAGLLSAFLWGLPTSAVCKVIEEDDDKPEHIISRKAVADSVYSSLGLTVLLAIGGSRSAAASSISALSVTFSLVESVFILLISLLLSGLGYLMFEKLMEIYISVNNKLPHFLTVSMVIITLCTLLIMSWGFCIPLIISSLMINKLGRIAKAPRELNLAALGILPILSLF